ncbi:ketopantoate reductase family protein [Plebeiibacterium sediminum]|uniref:2-dehydropantoate 2-reductase n=1 Tax=Plebeiibacterium sediminum TaxID=2992112 RepID=A0AAE3M8Z2_9BACT|nr:2-dehydropantoate 2-reductase [Plebeiobacterium sediminum]MCW3788785.1 2-dehydropantoate 2-reductase [Plebeiobacterium sediminum]
MNIAIIGTGGVGGYFGVRLAQAGHKVTFVARGKHGDAIKKSGLNLLSPKGDYVVENAIVVDAPDQIENPELVLIGVKAWQVKEVANQIKDALTKDTVVIPLQNGVMAAKELSDILPQQNVMGGLCNIFSKIKEPGVIEHMSAEPYLIFGELDNTISERAKTINNILTEAGIKNKLSEYIQGDTWKKFLLICLGGLGALTRANYGVLCETPELKEMMVQMIEEMYFVSQAEGVKLSESIKEKTIATTMSFAPNANSSMARDIWAGRPSELEYQNGSVVYLAQKHGIEVPVNYFIYHALLPQEKEARKQIG